MFQDEREPGEPRAATKEQQLQNLLGQKRHKEGQIRALKWVARAVQNQIDREFGQLETIEEAIKEM